MRASFRRIWGMMYRHLTLYRRSWPRLVELAYWPILQMCIWGFTTSYMAQRMNTAGTVNAGMLAGGALLGGVLLWEVALRSQMGVAISFLEELWSRNLGHVFVSPLRPTELVAALIGMSMLRMFTGVLPAILLAWLLYAYNLFAMGPIVVLPTRRREPDHEPARAHICSLHVARRVRCVLQKGLRGHEEHGKTRERGRTQDPLLSLADERVVHLDQPWQRRHGNGPGAHP